MKILRVFRRIYADRLRRTHGMRSSLESYRVGCENLLCMHLTAPAIEELPCRMRVSAGCEVDRIVFDSGLVRVGAFRCYPDDPSFRDSGPARNCCFVFPRTAVEIQHEHERAFVANPNVVTFYNQGQAYLRNPVSIEGDRCDWFGVEMDVVQDVVRSFDPAFEEHPERPFQFTRGWADPA